MEFERAFNAERWAERVGSSEELSYARRYWKWHSIWGLGDALKRPLHSEVKRAASWVAPGFGSSDG